MRQRVMWIAGFFWAVLLGLFTLAYASEDDFTVNKSSPDTAHIPYQPADDSQSGSSTPTHTIMVPTWPVQVPVNVPENVEEPPENPHAGENETPEADPEAP